MVTTIPTVDFNVETVEYKNLSFTVWDVGGPDLANAMTAAEVTERLGLQKEIDTQNVNIVVAALITRTDATASKVDQSSENETDLFLREQDGLRRCRQQARKVR